MRITGGTARGRPLRAPKGDHVRPTADKVRAAVFNIIAARSDVTDRRVLDLFAGTGALGLEALSRGAAHATLVDGSRESCRVAAENAERSGFADRCRIVRLELPAAVRRLAAEEARYGVVFVDPPYRRGLAARTLEALAEAGILEPGAWVFTEHATTDRIAERYGSLRLRDTRRYGSTALSIHEVEVE